MSHSVLRFSNCDTRNTIAAATGCKCGRGVMYDVVFFSHDLSNLQKYVHGGQQWKRTKYISVGNFLRDPRGK